MNSVSLKKLQLETIEMQIQVLGYASVITAGGEIIIHSPFFLR